jgi:polyisoprenoid-binding protein YceI
MPAWFSTNPSDPRAPWRAGGRRLALAVALALPLAARASGPSVRIDNAHSRVEVLVKATIGSFTAHLQTFDAAIRLATRAGPVEAARFSAPFDSIRTGVAARDRDMNAWQETSRFPRVEFRLTAIAPAGGAAYAAHGRLSLHGVSRDISFPVSITAGGGLWAVDGEATVDTRDFGLPVIRKFVVLKVDPVVRVRFHLQGPVTGE